MLEDIPNKRAVVVLELVCFTVTRSRCIHTEGRRDAIGATSPCMRPNRCVICGVVIASSGLPLSRLWVQEGWYVELFLHRTVVGKVYRNVV